MARKNNFLLGFGERLTAKVEVPSGGGDKNPPYKFSAARSRVENWLTTSVASFDLLSADAAPNDEVVGVLTLHPRYVSKSDFPRELLEATGLRAVGSKIERVRPERWGVEKHPDEAYTEALYVAGSRTRFREWQAQLPRWSENHKGADTLTHIESFGAFEASSKLRGLTEDVDREGVLEVVLHNSGDQRIVEAFAAYVLRHGGEPLRKYRRDIRGLTFFPVRTTFGRAEEIARYSFVRVARPMPVLRPSSPFLVRSMPTSPRATIPQTGPVDPTVKAVVFDGGLPMLSRAALSRWVQYIEPAGVGPAVPELENHGLAVTSALLFGQADQATALEALRQIKVAARGPKPSGALRELGIPVAVTAPEPNTWHEVIGALDQAFGPSLEGLRVAVQEYGASNPDLLAALSERKAQWTRVPVYHWALPEDVEPLKRAIRSIVAGDIDVVVFLTSVQVIHLLQIAEEMGVAGALREGIAKTVVLSIGPTTTEELEHNGIHPDFTPSHPKMGFLMNEASAVAGKLLEAKRRVR